jgi:hypothetical protein
LLSLIAEKLISFFQLFRGLKPVRAIFPRFTVGLLSATLRQHWLRTTIARLALPEIFVATRFLKTPTPRARLVSGAKATVLQTLTRQPDVSEPREASGLRVVDRRCSQVEGPQG